MRVVSKGREVVSDDSCQDKLPSSCPLVKLRFASVIIAMRRFNSSLIFFFFIKTLSSMSLKSLLVMNVSH